MVATWFYIGHEVSGRVHTTKHRFLTQLAAPTATTE
jgi:hypothetical protein